MAGKEVANEDRIIQITANGAWTPGAASGMTYTETMASKAKANNKFILINQISWVAVGCTFGPNTFVSGGSVSPIMATSTKCKCDNIFVLRKDDQGSCNGTFKPPSGPVIPCSCTFKIQDAGQIKVKAE